MDLPGADLEDGVLLLVDEEEGEALLLAGGGDAAGPAWELEDLSRQSAITTLSSSTAGCLLRQVKKIMNKKIPHIIR